MADHAEKAKALFLAPAARIITPIGATQKIRKLPGACRVFLLTWFVGAITVNGCSRSAKDWPIGSDDIDTSIVEDHDTYADKIAGLGGKVRVFLQFENSAITDNELADLDLPETVQGLSLIDTDITDVGVASLKRVANLEYIDLNGTLIGPSAVDDLVQIPKLRYASIKTQNMTSEGYEKLAQFLGSQHEKTPPDRISLEVLPRLPWPDE